jgi:hypothetical protein
MKYFLPLLVAFCFPFSTFCQDITGLWKGTLYNDSTKQYLDYEIVISKESKSYSAFSLTWFSVDGKKYYGIKKLDVRIAKDGKILLIDEKLVQENYPAEYAQHVQQLNVLDIKTEGSETYLEGPFVTKRTKKYKELTGRINIKRVNLLSQSDLMQYLQNSNYTNVTAGK